MSRKIFAAVLVLALSIVSQASMVYYTFDGAVDPTLPSSVVLPSTTTLHYVFAVDVDLPGYLINTIDGSTIPAYDNALYNYSMDFFYSDLMSDLVLPDEIPSNRSNRIQYSLTGNYEPTNPPSYNWLFGGNVNSLGYTRLSGGYMHNQVQIIRNSPISTWEVGQTFIGYEIAFIPDAGDRQRYFYSTLTLSDVRTTAPGTPFESVPEPGMFGLFAMGLLSIGGIGVIRRRK